MSVELCDAAGGGSVSADTSVCVGYRLYFSEGRGRVKDASVCVGDLVVLFLWVVSSHDAELALGCRDAQVSAQRDLEAAAQAHAMRCRDDRRGDASPQIAHVLR